MPDSKLTIGLFLKEIVNQNQLRQLRGVIEEAGKNNINLIAFSGKVLNSPTSFESQENIIYKFASHSRLDGLIIWAGSLNWFLSDDEMMDFFRSFYPLPIISVDAVYEGVPSIGKDDYNGMCAAVTHLILAHGKRRIAYLTGQRGHIGAHERFRAYVDTLAEHGIEIDPNLISPPNNEWDGVAMLKVLTDERKVDFDAIVSVNDYSLRNVFDFLEKRGKKVPKDFAVASFDNESTAEINQLTSADPYFPELGQKAVELLMRLIEGKEVPASSKVSPRLIIRQSCGCPFRSVFHAAVTQTDPPVEINKSSGIFTFDKYILKEMTIPLENIPEEIALDWIKQLSGTITQEIQNDHPGIFAGLLENILYQSFELGANNIMWQNVISVLRKYLMVMYYNQNDLLFGMENLIHQSRALLHEAYNSAMVSQRYKSEEFKAILSTIEHSLITTFDIDGLMDILAGELPKLDIKRCYLSLYSNSQNPEQTSRLIMAYNEKGRLNLNPGGLEFPSNRLIPDEIISELSDFNFILLPLCFQNEQFGFVLFEIGYNIGIIYESLRVQISSSLMGAALIKHIKDRAEELEHTNLELENAYQVLKENQQKLLISEKMASLGRLTSGIAHEMNTPLATVRAALEELKNLIDEYKESIRNPEVLPDDHLAIAGDMLKNLKLAIQSCEKISGFIRGIKTQTYDRNNKIMQTFEVSPVIADTLNLLTFALKRGRSKLEINLDDTVKLYGDPHLFSQIITNLIINSIDACKPDGGVIKVNLKKSDNTNLALEVEDTGCGIPQKSLKHIFDPLFTTKPFGEGTGLGLSIVHDIVKEMRGDIKVQSQPGKTIFIITLPLKITEGFSE
jgi:signal transduction histidine kinase/DNA-binding LacI/PurR family transcriptional regulator